MTMYNAMQCMDPLTFDPPLGIGLGVLDCPAGEANDGTLRQMLDGLATGHTPHVEGQRVLRRLLPLEGHLRYSVRHHDTFSIFYR